MSGCLDDNAIAALLESRISAEDRAPYTAHLDACASCRALVVDAAREEASEGRILEKGATLGRYVVLETIGAGAMGVVYSAYDPELDRRVALKLLRPDPMADGSSALGRGRLLREAQALAKLSHPNVIAIHDVGTLGGEVFLAMELALGGTLGDWLRKSPRTWQATAELLRQAGEGLAAAHEAGLIHRDLKPENILVGEDGRARVTDFGLARGAHECEPSDKDVEATLGPAAMATKLTTTGQLVGTPAYMAPEQLAGGAADARSDQFSFAVTMYEALHGERPFDGTDVGSLAAAIAKGEVRTAPAKKRVPSWLRRILLRGLAADPEQRFPSMRALLRTLRAGPRFSPRRIAMIAAAIAVVPAVAFGAVGASRKEAPMCTGAESAWNDAWNDAHEGTLRAAFARTGLASAPYASNEVARIMREERARWTTMHRDTCEATRVRGEQSESLLDARMRCLSDRRNEVAALVHVLEAADADLVNRSVAAALSLPSIDECADVRALADEAPLPSSPDLRARIARLADPTARAIALEFAGKYAEGLAVSAPLLEEAKAIGFAPSIAKVLLAEGRLAAGAHDYDRAERTLHEAAAVAQDAKDDGVAADAWIALVRIVGFNRSKPAEGRLWARYAESAIRRKGGDDEREALRLRNLGTVVWRREAQLDEARDLITRARALYEKSNGAHHALQIASCDEGMAGVYFDMARPEEALPLHRSAGEVRARLFGADHPSIATSSVNQGEDLTILGRPDEAIPLIEHAIAIAAPTRARGGDGYYRHRLAAAYRAKGEPERALGEDRLAVEASAAAGEAGGYWESWSLTGLGLDLLALGRPKEALSPLERAVSERTTGALPFEIAESRFALAQALFETGAKGKARARAIEAQATLRPDAMRYGGRYAVALDAIERWLAAHDDAAQ